MNPRPGRLARWLGVLLLAAGCAAQAATLRIASAFDPQTLDPHALALLYHSRVAYQLYDSLVGRDEQFRLEPALATSWQQLEPTRWRFRLREGVRFHDGSTMSADDVVFSIERALGRSSQRAFQLKGVTGARKVDALTVDFVLDAPDAVLPEKLQYIAIMSKAWAEAHVAAQAQDFNAKQEMHTVRAANGTGPYALVRYEPDVRVVLKRHAGWWGRDDPRNGKVDEVHFIVVKSDATRLAALASGEVDLVLDPPFQDIERLQREGRVKLTTVAELGQQYLTFDQSRAELEFSDVKGRNPFKDRRVRQAVWHAINVEAIVDKVLRGQAEPVGVFLSPLVDGADPALGRRLPYDPARARALLAEAGYPDGFAVTLDCVNTTWRQAVCQAAAAMLTQAGIRTTLRATAPNLFFPKLTQGTASFIEYGWTASPDAWGSLNGLFRTWDRSGLGSFNAGRYSSPALDAVIDAIRVEPDLAKRRAMVGQALRMVAEDLPYVPLYRRKLNWAMAREVEVVPWPNDTIELRWAKRH
ncbi:MAG: ABC transporter substrate-binding protein [Burkholderiales bacterium]|nr:ABC transporter substrate-binding protein [Burkholderiales bacterium]